jgi:hypothetical protein
MEKNGLFKITSTFNGKTYIWIVFFNTKIGSLTRHNIYIYIYSIKEGLIKEDKSHSINYCKNNSLVTRFISGRNGFQS